MVGLQDIEKDVGEARMPFGLVETMNQRLADIEAAGCGKSKQTEAGPRAKEVRVMQRRWTPKGWEMVFCCGRDAGKTYLLELELSPPANIGIGIKGSGDAASYSGGIHLGQTRE